MSPKPGEIWLADLGMTAKTRPVVIISRDDPDPPRALVIYVPVTRQYRGSAYEIQLTPVPWLDPDSCVNVQGIGSLARARLERKLGAISAEDYSKIRTAIAYACDLPGT